MITFRNFADYIQAEPFRPFRIKTAGGQSFDVRHPEMIMVGRTSVRVFGSPEPGAKGGERWFDVSMMLMETLEPLEPSAA
jgi:hypothetical protein